MLLERVEIEVTVDRITVVDLRANDEVPADQGLTHGTQRPDAGRRDRRVQDEGPV